MHKDCLKTQQVAFKLARVCGTRQDADVKMSFFVPSSPWFVSLILIFFVNGIQWFRMFDSQAVHYSTTYSTCFIAWSTCPQIRWPPVCDQAPCQSIFSTQNMSVASDQPEFPCWLVIWTVKWCSCRLALNTTWFLLLEFQRISWYCKLYELVLTAVLASSRRLVVPHFQLLPYFLDTGMTPLYV